jgi:hypothetical protein
MQATIFRCPNCGAELRFAPPGVGASAGARPGCPYDGLSYAELRAGHDAIYFGAWRKIEASPFEVHRAYRQLQRHLDATAKALAAEDLPAARRDLALAMEAYHGMAPADFSGNDLRLLDNALSYLHRVIDDLLHEKGLPPHSPMDFAEWYDAVEIPFRDAW